MPRGEGHWATTDRTGRTDVHRNRIWLAESERLVPKNSRDDLGTLSHGLPAPVLKACPEISVDFCALAPVTTAGAIHKRQADCDDGRDDDESVLHGSSNAGFDGFPLRLARKNALESCGSRKSSRVKHQEISEASRGGLYDCPGGIETLASGFRVSSGPDRWS
jgi:hypothetical protein